MTRFSLRDGCLGFALVLSLGFAPNRIAAADKKAPGNKAAEKKAVDEQAGDKKAVDKKVADGDVAKGKEVFEQCAVCHNVDNDEKKMGPSLKGLFKKPKLTNGKKMTDANVRAQINAGGNGMPAYEDMLSDEERNNLMAYLKTI